MNKEENLGEGTAEWTFDISNSISKHVYRADLVIEAFRYHAGLHSSIQHSVAHIYVNDNEIKLFTDALMPNGLDWGFDRKLSFRVESFIRNKNSLKVKLTVSNGTLWDIDEIRLDIITLNSKVRGWVFFVIGILLSPIADRAVSLLFVLLKTV
jgi:hypothetical protein